MASTIRHTKDDVFVVRGSGVAATDNQRVADAVAAANAYGRGTIVFDGSSSNNEVFITTEHVFTAPIGLECIKGTYVVRNTSAAAFSYGTATDPWDGTTGTVSSVSAGATELVSPSITLAKGDYVVVWGTNQLTDLTPHNSTIIHRPMEIHKISRVVVDAQGNSLNRFIFNDYFDDPVTTTPTIAKLPMLQGIRIRHFNAKVSSAVTGGDIGSLFTFNRCADLELYDLTLGDPWPGEMHFRYCYDIRRVGVWAGELQAFNSEASLPNYVMTDVVVNGVITSDCRFHGVRHAVTSGGIQVNVNTVPTYRYGGPKNRVFQNCRFGNNQQQLFATDTWTAMPMLDFHAEGRRDVVDNCTFVTPTAPTSGYNQVALNARARDVVVKNCTFFSNNGSYVAYIRGPNQTWKNNLFRGGLLIKQDNAIGLNANVDNLAFVNNTLEDMQQGLQITTGTGHEIIGNRFINCGSLLTQTPAAPAAPLFISALTNSSSRVRIVDNYLRKYSNTQSVGMGSGITAAQLYISGNDMSGYDNTSIGLDRTLTPTAELEVRYANLNRCPVFQYVTATAHGLTTASINKPINTSHGVYDDTTTQTVAGILADVIDPNTYVLYPPGAMILMAPALFNGATTGNGYWDLTDNRYESTKPVDSNAAAPIIIKVTFANANVVQARISTSL